MARRRLEWEPRERVARHAAELPVSTQSIESSLPCSPTNERLCSLQPQLSSSQVLQVLLYHPDRTALSMQSKKKSTSDDVFEAWSNGGDSSLATYIPTRIQAVPLPGVSIQTATSFTTMARYLPRSQRQTKTQLERDSMPMSYSSVVSGVQRPSCTPTHIPISVSMPSTSTSIPQTLPYLEYYPDIPIVDSISPDAWSLLPEEWIAAASTTPTSYVHRIALSSLVPSPTISSSSTSTSPTSTIDILPRSPLLEPHHHGLSFDATHTHAHGVYAPRALRARSASTASTSTLPEIVGDAHGLPLAHSPVKSAAEPIQAQAQAYQFNFSFNPGAKAFVPAFPPLVSTSSSTSTSTPARPSGSHSHSHSHSDSQAQAQSTSTTTLSTASASGSASGSEASTPPHSACTSTTSLSGSGSGSAPTSPSLLHKLSTTLTDGTASFDRADTFEGEVHGDQSIVPPLPPVTPPLSIFAADPSARSCPIAQYPPPTPYYRPWAAAFERGLGCCWGYGGAVAYGEGKGKGVDRDEVIDGWEMGKEVEREIQRCAEAVVCLRDWDGRRTKDLAWCLAYAASEPALPSLPSTSTFTSTSLGSPPMSPPPDGANMDPDSGGSNERAAATSGAPHPDLALFTSQLAAAFRTFYGPHLRAEFVYYVREYARETFGGWWGWVSFFFPRSPVYSALARYFTVVGRSPPIHSFFHRIPHIRYSIPYSRTNSVHTRRKCRRRYRSTSSPRSR